MERVTVPRLSSICGGRTRQFEGASNHGVGFSHFFSGGCFSCLHFGGMGPQSSVPNWPPRPPCDLFWKSRRVYPHSYYLTRHNDSLAR